MDFFGYILEKTKQHLTLYHIQKWGGRSPTSSNVEGTCPPVPHLFDAPTGMYGPKQIFLKIEYYISYYLFDAWSALILDYTH